MNLETSLYNQEGTVVGKIALPKQVFGAALNADLLTQVVWAQRSNARTAVAHTKDRSEVRGGGKKPWRQKGTGRARHASIRSPIWKGGGTTFGPRAERLFTRAINRKAARKALAVALSSKLTDSQLIVVDAITVAGGKTKEAARVVKSLRPLFTKPGATTRSRGSLLVITPSVEASTVLHRATRNIPGVETLEARNLNALATLQHQFLIVCQESLPVLEKIIHHA